MSVELKPGLNYIVGDKAYTPKEIIELRQRKAIAWLMALMVIVPLVTGVIGWIIGSGNPQVVVIVPIK